MPQLNRDGIALFYDEAGMGDPSMLLIHGGMGDHSHFTLQLEYFRRTHRTVVVDLRGHGHSDHPQQDYTIEGFADDLAWICAQLSISKPVIVGHSMGGAIALELAAHWADLAAGIVILDSPVVPPPAFVEAMQQLLEAVHTPAYQTAIRQFMGPFVGFADDPERQERFLNAMCSTPQHVLVSALENLSAYDTVAAAAACKLPLLYVSSGPWFTEVERFRQLCPQLITGQTVGSGHYHQLEVAPQINAMIERFLTVALSPPN